MTTPTRGLDLQAKYLDVRRVVLKKFGSRARRAGIDPEDLVQEVCIRIHKANQGPAAYDPMRAKPSRYIYLQARSALLNLLEKRESRPRVKLGLKDAEGEETDAAFAEVEAPEPFDPMAMIKEVARSPLEVKLLTLMMEGATDFEIIAKCGSSMLVLRTLAARDEDPDGPS